MHENSLRSTTWQLTGHFFRRFIENDVVDSDGDAVTTVARGLAIVAAPGLMFAFFLQNSYPQRTAWGRVEDQYSFVLFSFVTMAGIAIFEWEMLFPERLDFLVLTPLPLRSGQMLRAKAAALGCLLGSFVVAANVLGVLVLPMASKSVFWRMVLAQSVAVSLAGVFGALTVMDLGGLLLCVLPPQMFRRVSPVLQMLATAALVLLVIQYARFGDEMELLLSRPNPVVRCVPTVWFLGVFERLLHGGGAEAFAADASRRAWEATTVSAGLAVILYPLAWVRMQRMAVQGEVTRSRAPRRWWALVLSGAKRVPTERAVFSFIGKTMVRTSRYQVYLALYGGVGLALSMACAFSLDQGKDGVHVAVWPFGLHAVTPLLLFWTIAGLRMAFDFPQTLPARWVFRVTGAASQACARATRRWAGACGALLVVVLLALLGGMGWGWRALLVQGVWGMCFGGVLVEGFFVAQRGAPFTRPRSPGKTSLPAVLTLYLGVLPPLLFGVAWAEVHTERRLVTLIWPVAALFLIRRVLLWAREQLIWMGDEAEGADGEIQLLGLAGELRT